MNQKEHTISEIERAQLRVAVLLLLNNSNNGKGIYLDDAIVVLSDIVNDLKLTQSLKHIVKT